MEDDIGADMKVAFPAAEELGQYIASKSLTEVLQENVGGKLPDKLLRRKLEAYPIPQNCRYMGVPRTNHEIFKLLEHNIKSVDIRTYNMQCSITKTAVVVVRCADKPLAVRKSVKNNGVPPNNLEEILKECTNKFLADALAVTLC